MTKFTYKISPVSVECLDILVNIKHGQFTTSVSTNLLMLTPTCISTHHPNTKASISYSQFLRLRRLCYDEEDFLLQCSRMSEFFSARGYPTSVTENALRRAKQISRAYGLDPAAPCSYERKTYRLYALPSTQPPSLPNSATVGTTFCDRPLVAFMKDRNLREILVHSSLRSHANSTPCTFP